MRRSSGLISFSPSPKKVSTVPVHICTAIFPVNFFKVINIFHCRCLSESVLSINVSVKNIQSPVRSHVIPVVMVFS